MNPDTENVGVLLSQDQQFLGSLGTFKVGYVKNQNSMSWKFPANMSDSYALMDATDDWGPNMQAKFTASDRLIASPSC